MNRRTADSWTDILGQKYSPGDIVAISIINGRSPQTVIARVETIFLDDSQGQPYQSAQAIKLGEGMKPIDKSIELTANDQIVPWGKNRGMAYRCYQSCSVQCTPLVDARGFSRWSDRRVSYTIPENIIKVNVTEADLTKHRPPSTA